MSRPRCDGGSTSQRKYARPRVRSVAAVSGSNARTTSRPSRPAPVEPTVVMKLAGRIRGESRRGSAGRRGGSGPAGVSGKDDTRVDGVVALAHDEVEVRS